MSSPVRSPLALPGQFPDDEVLVADILGEALVVDIVRENGGADSVPMLGRVDTDTSSIEPPAITCYAPPGRSSVDRLGSMKTCFLYVDCVGPDRDTAKAMGEAVQSVLWEYRHGGLWKGVQIHRVEQITSPTELPLRYTEDPRHWESGWSLRLRPHRGPVIHP